MFGGRGISKNTIYALLIVAVIGFFIFGLILGKKDDTPIANEYTNIDGPAIINNAQKLYETISNDSVFTSFRDDIAYFARSTFQDMKEIYSNGLVFVINDSSIQKSDGKINFSGSFIGSTAILNCKIVLLNNGRASLSIIDQTNGKNIDASLSTNSKTNAFIGSLPLKNKNFTINYLAENKSYYVVLSRNNGSTLNSARKTLMEGLGIDSLENEEISYVALTKEGGIVSVENPDLPID